MRALIRIGLFFLFLAQLNLNGFGQSGIITTYVGPQLPLNGTHATTKSIDGPSSVASDGAGGFYVASLHQNRVYRVAADGTLSLVAGSGAAHFGGDGGPATSAQLFSPRGVAVDTAGNLLDDTVTITLGSRQQIARFLHQDVNRLKFKGSLVFRAQAGGTFVVVGLLQKQQIFTVIPVTQAKAPDIPN